MVCMLFQIVVLASACLGSARAQRTIVAPVVEHAKVASSDKKSPHKPPEWPSSYTVRFQDLVFSKRIRMQR
jgi:hypothetical protein